MFKSGDGGLTSHSGKVIQEFIQSLPAFQIVKQSLERDACAHLCPGPKVALSARRFAKWNGGRDRTRTCDLLRVKQAL